MRILLVFIVLFGSSIAMAKTDSDPGDTFWSSLQSLCGKAYSGKVVEAPSSDTTFKGKQLSMYVFSCQLEKIKIRVAVGDDRSRTWLIYRYEGRFLLKHDHRKNGKADGVTDYGGWTSNSGSATMQVFPADQETFAKIPEASSNVWWINLESGKQFTYNLHRIGTDRKYSLRFDLTKTVPFLLEK
ncbi:MAG: hypothetical protein HKN33_09515 [Pyrinomonadaceae bacterium]|nr:hypothetical protein [Pyrinomonadaceae bacterium]